MFGFYLGLGLFVFVVVLWLVYCLVCLVFFSVSGCFCGKFCFVFCLVWFGGWFLLCFFLDVVGFVCALIYLFVWLGFLFVLVCVFAWLCGMGVGSYFENVDIQFMPISMLISML